MKIVKTEPEKENVMENTTTNETNTISSANSTTTIDKHKVAELQERFDLMQNQLNTKQYDVLLNEEQTSFFFENFYENVQWKGYESYAISETYDALQSIVNSGSLKGTVKTEIVEATFHFLKNHVGTGTRNARLFRQVCDQFAIPMTEINNDRQSLKDLSLELVSAEQGIPVEQFVERLKNSQQGYHQG